MSKIPDEYKNLVRIINGVDNFSCFEAVIKAALSIADDFRKFHNKGLNYNDFGYNNIFVNPQSGDVLICKESDSDIAGRYRCVAPEILRREKKTDIHTDNFSLAVVIYQLLFFAHPLEGKTLLMCQQKEKEKIFAENPVFVFDPDDNSNGPDEKYHEYELFLWSIYPEFIHEICRKSFSRESMIEGGKDLENRTTSKEWMRALIRLRALISKCPKCGEKVIWKDPLKQYQKCSFCEESFERPMMIKVNDYNIVLEDGVEICKCHVVRRNVDFKSVVARVVYRRTNPEVPELENCSDSDWEVTMIDGEKKVCERGKTIQLDKGVKIKFGEKTIQLDKGVKIKFGDVDAEIF